MRMARQACLRGPAPATCPEHLPVHASAVTSRDTSHAGGLGGGPRHRGSAVPRVCATPAQLRKPGLLPLRRRRQRGGGAEGQQDKACGGCRGQRLCSQECQRAPWRAHHRAACKLVAQPGEAQREQEGWIGRGHTCRWLTSVRSPQGESSRSAVAGKALLLLLLLLPLPRPPATKPPQPLATLRARLHTER